jgi:hypothetical protein
MKKKKLKKRKNPFRKDMSPQEMWITGNTKKAHKWAGFSY